jgi:AcrR family transcriptional regulator
LPAIRSIATIDAHRPISPARSAPVRSTHLYDLHVPPDASATRQRLLDAAAHEFAEHGVWNASLIEVTRRAGQRNRAALRYHFGSREAVLGAVLERHVEFLSQREGELLAKALATPDDDVAAVVEAIVRPAAELAASGWRGRACLLIIAELAGEDPARLRPELESVLARTGGHEVYALLQARMPEVSPALVAERFSLITSFILRAVADRARALERHGHHGHPSRPQLDDETFVENLVAMVAAAVSAWAPS